MHIALIFLVGTAYGLMTLSNHKVGQESRVLGPLLILVPAFVVGLSYTLLADPYFSKTSMVFSRWWWVFLLYAPLIWGSNWFRAHGLFGEKFSSAAVFLNFSVVFALIIESVFYENKFSVSVVVGILLLFGAAILINGRDKISIKSTTFLILMHGVLAGINRNVDFFLLSNGVDGLTIVFLQELIILPILILYMYPSVKKCLSFAVRDIYVWSSMLLAMMAIPFSFVVVKSYGPYEVLLAITVGVLIAGIAENRKTLHVSKSISIGASIMALLAVILMVVG